MSTRSDIIVHHSDGTWKRIYCHIGGYVKGNGRILFNHYSSQKRAEDLVSLGDLSVLAPSLEKPEDHSFDTPVVGHCIAYGRDRGETDIEAQSFPTLAAAWPEEDTWTAYTYVWDNGKWQVAFAEEGTQTLIDLELALHEDETTD